MLIETAGTGIVACVGKDGQRRTFQFDYERALSFDCETNEPLNKWIFRAYRVPPLTSGEWFECSFVAVNADKVRSDTMQANANEYIKVGLPEAMIRNAARVLGKQVISSSNRNTPQSEFRTGAATKVWQRLQEAGLATYNEDTDRFTLAL